MPHALNQNSDPAERKVAIAIETFFPFPWHLEVTQGIMTYGEQHGWNCTIDPYLILQQRNKGPVFDGVIGRLSSQLISIVENTQLPAVNVMGSNFTENLPHLPSLTVDMAEMMRMAVEHLLACGYTQFGYVGLARLTSEKKKVQRLADILRQAGVSTLEHILLPDDFENDQRTTLAVGEKLSRWLVTLNKPVALVVLTPTLMPLIVPLCKELGLRVPQDVGIIGLVCDEATSLTSSPALSYVNSDFFSHGYQAAEMLDKLMAGETVHPVHRLFSPERVMVRESTDVTICDDALVSDVLQFLSNHIRRSPTIEEVADHFSVSRRTLERRFSESLGRTINAEIKRLKVEHIKSLLLETKLTVSEIAVDLGFSSSSYLTKYFKNESGLKPSDYRKKYKK